MCDLLFQRSMIHLVFRVLTAKNVLNPMFHLCRKAHSNSIGTRSETKELDHVHDVCVSRSVLSQIPLFLKRNSVIPCCFCQLEPHFGAQCFFYGVSDRNALPVDRNNKVFRSRWSLLKGYTRRSTCTVPLHKHDTYCLTQEPLLLSLFVGAL